jgi:peptidoglycan/LPS O-acetylase OafA/YrhL
MGKIKNVLTVLIALPFLIIWVLLNMVWIIVSMVWKVVWALVISFFILLYFGVSVEDSFGMASVLAIFVGGVVKGILERNKKE